MRKLKNGCPPTLGHFMGVCLENYEASCRPNWVYNCFTFS